MLEVPCDGEEHVVSFSSVIDSLRSEQTQCGVEFDTFFRVEMTMPALSLLNA
jgi:hypothetical protein